MRWCMIKKMQKKTMMTTIMTMSELELFIWSPNLSPLFIVINYHYNHHYHPPHHYRHHYHHHHHVYIDCYLPIRKLINPLLHLLIISLLPIITSSSTIITSSSIIIIYHHLYHHPWITSSLSRLLGQRNVIYIFFVLALWKATGVYEVFFALTSFVHYFRWTWTEWGILWWMDR